MVRGVGRAMSSTLVVVGEGSDGWIMDDDVYIQGGGREELD